MINLIMLGQVPGTSIQITFWSWILAVSFGMGVCVIWQRQRFEKYFWVGVITANLQLASHRPLTYLRYSDQIAL